MPATDIDIEAYRPVSKLRRLLIAVLAVATAVTIVLTLVGPPGAAKTKRLPPADAALCAPGQTTDCLGGTARVIAVPVLPAAGPAASAAR